MVLKNLCCFLFGGQEEEPLPQQQLFGDSNKYTQQQKTMTDVNEICLLIFRTERRDKTSIYVLGFNINTMFPNY